MSSEKSIQDTDLPTNDTGPIELSFPVMLRNPGIANHFLQLRDLESTPHAPSKGPRKQKRVDNEGKRWIRRKENARFVGNPHIVQAIKADFAVSIPHPQATFPEPLPAYLSRNVKLPASAPPLLDPQSANAGRFSLSLKGMRRDLRRAGFRAQVLVRDVEAEILSWLQGGTLLSPDAVHPSFTVPGRPLGESKTINEVSRTPLQMVWYITDDPFARYVVHCCARYYEIVSFSRDTSGERLTYLLRPNVTRPDSYATMGMFTPPVTDTDYSSQIDTDTESDGVSEILVEISGPEADQSLAPILEKPALVALNLEPDNDTWSVVSSADINNQDDDRGYDGDLATSINCSLTLSRHHDLQPYLSDSGRIPPRSKSLRRHLGRSNSSPSPSPVRRPARRTQSTFNPPRQPASHSTFFEYLFLS